ncbi:hypothetical protein T492DRAFT_831365 [Pavlovales sp. CCMP2436]|nr:hypothetical protein T492DRAFT_831365 [Pavlovales sp. CCMP2436]
MFHLLITDPLYAMQVWAGLGGWRRPDGDSLSLIIILLTFGLGLVDGDTLSSLSALLSSRATEALRIDLPLAAASGGGAEVTTHVLLYDSFIAATKRIKEAVGRAEGAAAAGDVAHAYSNVFVAVAAVAVDVAASAAAMGPATGNSKCKKAKSGKGPEELEIIMKTLPKHTRTGCAYAAVGRGGGGNRRRVLATAPGPQVPQGTVGVQIELLPCLKNAVLGF